MGAVCSHGHEMLGEWDIQGPSGKYLAHVTEEEEEHFEGDYTGVMREFEAADGKFSCEIHFDCYAEGEKFHAEGTYTDSTAECNIVPDPDNKELWAGHWEWAKSGAEHHDASTEHDDASTEHDDASKPASAAPAASGGGGGDFQSSCLEAHNRLRALHGAPPLQWSASCEENAGLQAQECSDQDSLFHGNCDTQGQNAAMHSDPDTLTATYATQMWYDEYSGSGPVPTDFGGETGHFTQVVWKGTTHVGAVRVGQYLIANYEPAGNMAGDFEDNVLEPSEDVDSAAVLEGL